jgi:hypothetical protein
VAYFFYDSSVPVFGAVQAEVAGRRKGGCTSEEENSTLLFRGKTFTQCIRDIFKEGPFLLKRRQDDFDRFLKGFNLGDVFLFPFWSLHHSRLPPHTSCSFIDAPSCPFLRMLPFSIDGRTLRLL